MTDNQLNIANHVQFSSDYYINKNLSEIVMSYIKTFDTGTTKTIKNVGIAVCILISAEITKSIVLDFLREQKKQVNEGLMEIIKEVKIFPALVYGIKLPFMMVINSYELLTNQYKRIFYKNKNDNKQLIVDDEKIFTVEPTQIFISNLLTYVETNENCTYNKKYNNNFTINKNNINNDITIRNINIIF